LPIEFLSWDCLTIGALGWGQIQIADAIKIDWGCSRRKWMVRLCDVMLDFYPREIDKIRERERITSGRSKLAGGPGMIRHRASVM
jgi:hypothetical protein